MKKPIITIDAINIYEDIEYIAFYLPNEYFDEQGQIIKPEKLGFDCYIKVEMFEGINGNFNIDRICFNSMDDAKEPYIEIPSSSSFKSIDFVNSNVTIHIKDKS